MSALEDAIDVGECEQQLDDPDGLREELKRLRAGEAALRSLVEADVRTDAQALLKAWAVARAAVRR